MQRFFAPSGRACAVAAAVVFLCGCGAVGPARADLPNVADGFKIRPVAAVPAVQFPCQVATAPDGSLFVGEDPMDQNGPADKSIDRILRFRDGKNPVVFADKPYAIFGMVWHDGALYVMNMPRLSVFRDRDGDGKTDERTELFTDLGAPAGTPNDFNDHIVSGLKIGIDGYLYISVGGKGVPKATGPDQRTVQLRGGGVLRSRTDGSGLEVFSSVGAKYPRDELIIAVLYPSAKVSSGYEPTTFALVDGRVVTGIIRTETADSVEIVDADAKLVRIARSEIEARKRSEVSLMPNGLAKGLSTRDFADLITYLETLRDEVAWTGLPSAVHVPSR
jgi:putative heme-binding domain-containing protein